MTTPHCARTERSDDIGLPEGIELREAVPVDALCISVLATQVFLDTYATKGIRSGLAREVLETLSLTAVEREIGQPGITFVVAESNGHLVGFAELTARARHELVDSAQASKLNRLYVQERFAGVGIGRALLACAEAHARAGGACRIWLTAWVGNARALEFYVRQGYRDLGSTVYEFQGEQYENRLFAKELVAELAEETSQQPRRELADERKIPLPPRGAFTYRPARPADLAELRELMTVAIRRLVGAYLDPAGVEASFEIMGLDTQLIDDGTYFVVQSAGRIAGCGGWSRRATMFGGDHSAGRDARLLDPVSEAARVRAMYTHPDFARRGVGRLILSLCEAAAAREGFRSLELVATVAGESLYVAYGFSLVKRIEVPTARGRSVPCAVMSKLICAA